MPPPHLLLVTLLIVRVKRATIIGKVLECKTTILYYRTIKPIIILLIMIKTLSMVPHFIINYIVTSQSLQNQTQSSVGILTLPFFRPSTQQTLYIIAPMSGFSRWVLRIFALILTHILFAKNTHTAYSYSSCRAPWSFPCKTWRLYE